MNVAPLGAKRIVVRRDECFPQSETRKARHTCSHAPVARRVENGAQRRGYNTSVLSVACPP